ncbi:protein-serine/threonine phosphatase PrpC [Thiomicrorhabdus hydrogeniphila]
MLQITSFSKQGREKANQDCVFFTKKRHENLVAIADGMGGLESGDLAASCVIDVLTAEFEKSDFDYPYAFRQIKNQIDELAVVQGYEKIGSTLTSCLITNMNVKVGHVGDCRLYHLRNNGIVTITKDQTEVQKLIDEGILSKNRAKKYSRKNILLSAITNFTDYDLFLTSFTVEKGDRLILMSDGAYSLIRKVEIRDISVNSLNIEDLKNNVLNLIESRDIKDDYSAIFLEV